MNISTIILSPVMTEKSLSGGRQGRYTFMVDRRATKTQIKEAVEAQFSVSVMKVNTLINKSGVKRSRSRSKNKIVTFSKKAIVSLAGGKKIEELEMEEGGKGQESTKRDKKVQKGTRRKEGKPEKSREKI